MDSSVNFSLFSNDIEVDSMENLDLGLGLFPELAPLNSDLSDEEYLVDTTKVGMVGENIELNHDPYLTANNSTTLNDSHVQTRRMTVNAESRIVKIQIAKAMKLDEQSKTTINENIITAPSKSETSYSDDSKYNVLSKNAIAARENRIKKKKYIEEMEKSVSLMSSQLSAFKKQTEEHVELIKTLKTENRYLRNVLANDKEISALLKTVKKTPGLKFNGSSITKRQNSSDDNSNEVKTPRKRRRGDNSLSSFTSSEDDGFASDEPVGVCLHVGKGSLSIEFCSTCSSRVSSRNLEP